MDQYKHYRGDTDIKTKILWDSLLDLELRGYFEMKYPGLTLEEVYKRELPSLKEHSIHSIWYHRKDGFTHFKQIWFSWDIFNKDPQKYLWRKWYKKVNDGIEITWGDIENILKWEQKEHEAYTYNKHLKSFKRWLKRKLRKLRKGSK